MILVFLILLFILKFNSPAAYIDYLIGLLLMLCFASAVFTLWVRINLHVQADSQVKYIHEGDDINITVRILAPDFFSKMRAVVELSNLQRGEHQTEKRIITEPRTELHFSGMHTGTIELRVKYVEVFGAFGVLRLWRRNVFETRINVYPNAGPAPDRFVRMSYAQGSGETQNAKGDDYTEIFELRPFREGDQLRHIHRQLSAKYDEYIVKVGSDSRRKIYNYYIENGLDFPEMSARIAQMFTLLSTLEKEDGSLMAAAYRSRFYAIVSMSQLYGLADRIYEDYLPADKTAGGKES
ncbi:MAG: DUF58 domain-containing protein [Firmicutes bacterium]|nr:DUF58 domain-containing protein [Bacillota bacterium]